MKLTKKLIIILIAAIILPLILGISFTYISIKHSMEKIEVENAVSKLNSVKGYLDSLTNDNGSTYLAWTVWSEYYNAIDKKDSKWIEDNVYSSVQENTPAEAMITTDKNGKIIGQINVPKDWNNFNLKEFNLYKNLNDTNHFSSGVFYTSDGLYIATIVKSVKSDDINFANPNGYTIYARKLTERMMEQGKKIMNVDIAIKLDDGKIWATNDKLKNITNKSNDFIDKEVKTDTKIEKDLMFTVAKQEFKDSTGKAIGVLTIETKTKSSVSALNTLYISAVILVVIVLGFSVLTLIRIRKTVVTPINEMTNIIKHRDLSQLLKVRTNDEIGTLSFEFNRMLEDQREVIHKFNDAARLIGTTSEQVSFTTNELSSTSQTQVGITEEFTCSIENMDTKIQDISINMNQLASNIGDVTNSIGDMSNNVQDISKSIEEAFNSISSVSLSTEQLNNSIKSISIHAKEVEIESESAVRKAKEGNIAVVNTISEMDKISQAVNDLTLGIQGLGLSAEMIGDIVNVIDDIAEQTNLLSLNAAIEAARAGEAGRGFAVVANSIRGLAEKSGEATKDIAKIIKGIQSEVTNAVSITNESTHRVKDGVQYVKSTGMVFEDIFKAINNTSDLIQQIANAIGQQEDGSREITAVIEKMRDFLSQLSASAEEQAAGTDEIVRSVGRINFLVQQASSTVKEHAVCSQEVVKLIQGITEGTTEISSGSEEIATAINNLVIQAQTLIKTANQFKI